MAQHKGGIFSLLFLLLLASSQLSTATAKIKLSLQGFAPGRNDVLETEGIIPAALVALKEINENDTLLADYELDLPFRDSMCEASEATWQLIQSVLGENGKEDPAPHPIFFGGGCSPATEPVAALTGRFYNATQISYGASSPTLSDRNMFPKFFRTIPSETQANGARFALMEKYNWMRVATLHETRNIFSLTVEDFHQRYDRLFNETDEEENDEDLILRSFTDDPEIPLKQIMEKDIRIIFAYMYENKAAPTLCQAYHLGLTTEQHVWVLPAWFAANWWREREPFKDVTDEQKNCTVAQMDEAVNYTLYLDSYHLAEDPNATSPSGLNYEQFSVKFNEERDRLAEINGSLVFKDTQQHIYSTFAYDAVYAVAYALDKVDKELKMSGLGLQNFTYDNAHNISSMIFDAMGKVSFNGISGKVSFDENGTRVGMNALYQLAPNETGDINFNLVAIHDPSTGELKLVDGMTIGWKGDGPPRDRRTPETVYLNRQLIIACGVFTGIAIIIAIALLIFNIVTITKPLIANSAPLINITVIVGCIIMLATCYLLGIDSATPPSDDYVDTEKTDDELMSMYPEAFDARQLRYTVICHFRLWLLTLGFTLSFGALFAKTWQVYRVYTNPKLKKEDFKMWNFLIIMGIFLFIDVAYLSFWSGKFPLRRSTEDRVDQAKDINRIYEECDCDNFGYLIGALYVYKGLLVVFGLFLAYESRNVKYIYINDSRFVSIAMYIVVIMVGIGAPLSLVLAIHFFIDPAYGLSVFMIIAACMSCLLIIHIPKFIYMWKGLDTMVSENTREEVTVSDGLQLGRTTQDQGEIQTVETEVNALKQKVQVRDLELHELEQEEAVRPMDLESGKMMETEGEKEGEDSGLKPRTGSDGDSGVLVMEDGDGSESNGHGSGATSTSPASTDPPEALAPIQSTKGDEEEEGTDM